MTSWILLKKFFKRFTIFWISCFFNSGYIGSEIGENLDSRVAASILETNKTNETTRWKNPDEDLNASITPTKTFKNESNDDCREFEYSYIHKGTSSQGKNIACRDSSGNWKIVGPAIEFSPI